MIIYEKRACAILYNLLKTTSKPGVFMLPANACPIVAAVFLKSARQFEFIDISKQTLCIDENIVLEKLRHDPEKYSGVLFIRTYGINSSFENFFQQIKAVDEKIILIDDRCLAPPEFSGEEDSCADLVLFSTGYAKFVDLGWGGFAAAKDNLNYKRHPLEFNNKALQRLTADIKSALAGSGRFSYQDSPWLDNSFPEVKFEEYKGMVRAEADKSFQIKEEINHVYYENIPQAAQLKPDYQKWRFNLLLPQKDKLLKDIFGQGLFASSHYASLAGIFDHGPVLPEAENLHSKVVNLFNDRYFNVDQAVKASRIVNRHLEKYS